MKKKKEENYESFKQLAEASFKQKPETKHVEKPEFLNQKKTYFLEVIETNTKLKHEADQERSLGISPLAALKDLDFEVFFNCKFQI